MTDGPKPRFTVKMENLAISITSEHRLFLEQVSIKTDRSVSAIVRTLIKEAMEKKDKD